MRKNELNKLQNEVVFDDSTLGQENQSVPETASMREGFDRERLSLNIHSFRKIGRWGLRGTVIVGLVAGGMYLKDMIDEFTPDASHKVELDIGAPKTQIFEDQALKFARVDSAFDYRQKTSLDRFGPINCDVTIDATGKNKVQTETNGEVIVDKLEVIREGKKSKIKILGDLNLGRTSVDWSDNLFRGSAKIGGTDVCIGANELYKAISIADVTTEQAGQVAAGCALSSPDGETVFEQSIADFVSKTPLLDGVSPDNIEIDIGDYYAESAKLLSKIKLNFTKKVDHVVEKYLRETKDHKHPKINDDDLLDCSKHKITIGSHQNS